MNRPAQIKASPIPSAMSGATPLQTLQSLHRGNPALSPFGSARESAPEASMLDVEALRSAGIRVTIVNSMEGHPLPLHRGATYKADTDDWVADGFVSRRGFAKVMGVTQSIFSKRVRQGLYPGPCRIQTAGGEKRPTWSKVVVDMIKKEAPTKPMLSVVDLSELAGLSPITVRHKMAKGELSQPPQSLRLTKSCGKCQMMRVYLPSQQADAIAEFRACLKPKNLKKQAVQ